MKTIIVSFIILALSTSTFAQKTIRIDNSNDNNQEIQTLFKRNKRDGFYGAMTVGYSPINGSDGVVFSSRGCWIVDHWFALGVGGTAFANNIEGINDLDQTLNQLNNNTHLAGGYGGFIIEPMLAPLKPLHLSFPLLIGAGGASTYTDYYYSSTYDVGDLFAVVEPGIELEVNFTRWLRIAAFATYRFTSDIKIEDINPDALRSYSVGMSFKVGLF
jgi:hypothetical protein